MEVSPISALRLGAVALTLVASAVVATPRVVASASGEPPHVCHDATVRIHGGNVSNQTNIDISADGGTAVADASGGDDNLAVVEDSRRRRGDRNRRDRDVASAGNGGTATASANGGAIVVGNVNSGGNEGNLIAVGDTFGGHCGGTAVLVDGGTVSNETSVSLSADGGTALADASGGDDNIAITGDGAGNGGRDVASAGNGGTADASANGGAIVVGDINSGGNLGNVITVGNTVGGGHPPIQPVPVPDKPKPTVPVRVVPIVPDKPRVIVITTKPTRLVAALPSTGAGGGLVQGQTGSQILLLLVGSIAAAGAAGVALRKRLA